MSRDEVDNIRLRRLPPDSNDHDVEVPAYFFSDPESAHPEIPEDERQQLAELGLLLQDRNTVWGVLWEFLAFALVSETGEGDEGRELMWNGQVWLKAFFR
jgi:hypothetical protein